VGTDFSNESTSGDSDKSEELHGLVGGTTTVKTSTLLIYSAYSEDLEAYACPPRGLTPILQVCWSGRLKLETQTWAAAWILSVVATGCNDTMGNQQPAVKHQKADPLACSAQEGDRPDSEVGFCEPKRQSLISPHSNPSTRRGRSADGLLMAEA